jgi:hypothetical protein
MICSARLARAKRRYCSACRDSGLTMILIARAPHTLFRSIEQSCLGSRRYKEHPRHTGSDKTLPKVSLPQRTTAESCDMVARGLFLASLFALALGNPLARRAMQVHETRDEIPEGFVQQGPAAPDTVLNLRIALRQSDPQGLEDKLMAVSTPGNELYGQHLTKEEVCHAP